MDEPVTILTLIVTGFATLIAFQRPDLKAKWIFNPQAILADKQYYRMITSGLIHADWFHFGFNAISFYCFARYIEWIYGAHTLLLVYFSAIFGGSLLALVIHRNHEYLALGASGGVCGVIFASIFLLPDNSITIFPLPIGIPAYLYAVLFLVGSFIAHRRGKDHVGHDAHIGGAIIGLLVATVLYPHLITAHLITVAPWLFATVILLSLVVLLFLILDPLHVLKLDLTGKIDPSVGGERERRYIENQRRNKKIEDLDKLLEKVAQKGMQSLSSSERAKMEQLSKEIYDDRR